ncbi:sterile alpha motif (SAM) domain-containing protein isoform X3 [Carex rostrata]
MRSHVPNNPSKKKPCMSQTLPPAQAFFPLTNGDDDDDFQSPISVTRSSLRRVSNSQPLRPCNDDARPKKRSRLVGSSGKENSEIDQISENASRVTYSLNRDMDSRISCLFPDRFDKKMVNLSLPVVAEALDGSSGICCSLSEPPVSEASEAGILAPCSSFSEFDKNWDVLGEFASIEEKRLEHEVNWEDKLKNPDGSYVTPSEFKLEVSQSYMRNGEVGEKFEPGTQLNELMNLCSELDSQQDFNFDKENDFLQGHGSVQCPLCGHDLSDLSEPLRQLHTNDCLDKGDTRETPDSMCNQRSSLSGENVDTVPVIEWLRDLGLSRYEDIFIKEEIDLDSLQWLTEEDLLNIGITALGPRKKIAIAIKDLCNKNDHSAQAAQNNSPITVNSERAKVHMGGNKLITEYFRGSIAMVNGASSLKSPTESNKQTSTNTKKKSRKSSISKRVARDITPWCWIAGTPFRVDAFRYLSGDCSHWFLTHFHIDHYQGLTKNFCHGKIYCSSVTACLINLKIGIPWEKIHILPLNQKTIIGGVGVTCFDANHCPGAIIILFEPPNGKAVLHTGDFRFSSEMGNNAVLNKSHIHTLILDTTYCNPRYDFPKQDAVIQFVIEAIQAEAFNPKTLFLIGSYTIGKERLFVEVGRMLKKKIYVGAAKLSVLRCLEMPEKDMHWLTANEAESHIHVVPMWTLASFKRLKHISNQYTGLYDLLVAFSPTGWTFGKGQKRTPGRRWKQGSIIRYEVPYSEHCSFGELREFVRFISPEHIITSVNNDGPQNADAMRALLMSDA